MSNNNSINSIPESEYSEYYDDDFMETLEEKHSLINKLNNLDSDKDKIKIKKKILMLDKIIFEKNKEYLKVQQNYIDNHIK